MVVVPEVQPATVRAPAREVAAVRRDLPAAVERRERHDVDLRPAGLRGGVGQPAAVGRKVARPDARIRIRDPDGLSVTGDREGDQVLGVVLLFHFLAVDDVLAVRRPVVGPQIRVAVVAEQLLVSHAVRRLAIDLPGASCIRLVGDPLAVGGPQGFPVFRLVFPAGEREARPCAALEIDDPQIANAVRFLDRGGDPGPVGGQRELNVVVRRADRLQLLTLRGDPREPGAHVPSRMVREETAGTGRETADAEVRFEDDVLGDRHRLAGEDERVRVELLGHQRGAPHREQVALGVERAAGGGGDQVVEAALDAADADLPIGCVAALGEVEEVPAVGQEPRLPVRALARLLAVLEGRDLDDLATPRGDTLNLHARTGREHEDALRAPVPAASVPRIGHGEDAPAVECGAPDLPLGKERDRTAVGGPERPRAALGPRHGSGFRGIQRAHPHAGRTGLFLRDERQRAPVRRDAGLSAAIGRGQQAVARRRLDGDLQDLARRGARGEQRDQDRGQQQEHSGGRFPGPGRGGLRRRGRGRGRGRRRGVVF